MAKRFRTPFAENGDRTTVQDVPPADGTVNYDTGYTPQYSLDIVSDPTARRVNRDRFNQIMHDVTSNLQEWQNQLYPAYVPPSSNGGTALSYQQGMVVTFSGSSRISLIDNNTTQPDSSSWDNAWPLPVGVGGTGAENASDARTNLGILPASNSAAGLARIATQPETDAGSNANAYITPQTLASRLSSAPQTAKAWANVSSSGTILSSHNVSSVTDGGTGISSVNFTNNVGSDPAILAVAYGTNQATTITCSAPTQSGAVIRSYAVNTPADLAYSVSVFSS